jgi:hypothetical protein
MLTYHVFHNSEAKALKEAEEAAAKARADEVKAKEAEEKAKVW